MHSRFRSLIFRTDPTDQPVEVSRSKVRAYAFAKVAVACLFAVALVAEWNRFDAESEPEAVEAASDGPIPVVFEENLACDVQTIANLSSRAERFHREGKARKAVETYRDILRRDPELYRLRTSREHLWKHYASDLAAIGRFEAASTIAERLDDRDTNSESLELRGRIAYLAGNLDESRRLWERSLKADPKRFSPPLQLGLLEIRSRDYGNARRYLDSAYGLQPESLEINLALARLERLLGRSDESLEYQSRSRTIRSRNPMPPKGMGTIDD